MDARIKHVQRIRELEAQRAAMRARLTPDKERTT